MLHDNNAETLLKSFPFNYFPIDKQVIFFFIVNDSLILLNTFELSLKVLTIYKIRFRKEFEAITVELSVQSSGKLLKVICNLGTIIYTKILTFRSFF